MVILARKKQEAPASGGAPAWMSTFADLMNLLLCFFVLLFAFSDINQDKFEEVIKSLSSSIGVLEGGGGSSIKEGELIASGMEQMSMLDTYMDTVNQSNNTSAINKDGKANTNEPINSEAGNAGTQVKQNPKEFQGSASTDISVDHKEVDIDEAVDKLNEAMANSNEDIYDKVSDLTEKYNLGNDAELSIANNNKYVLITLNGSVLFDSGEASIKETAQPILNKIGNILVNFEGYQFEIIGHTDNVPITDSKFQNNNWLSNARALNAAEYLISKRGIDPATLKCSGRGEYEPISSNATAEGRAKNRRIEIKIYNEFETE